MKLDPGYLRFLSKDEFRILTAIEQGMKNHDLVPTPLIISICTIFLFIYHSVARMKANEAKRAIAIVHKYKLVWHSSAKCM